MAHLKLFDGREWKWFQVKLLHTDMEYLRKKWNRKKASAPTLERNIINISFGFLYGGSKLIENSDKRTGNMQR